MPRAQTSKPAPRIKHKREKFPVGKKTSETPTKTGNEQSSSHGNTPSPKAQVNAALSLKRAGDKNSSADFMDSLPRYITEDLIQAFEKDPAKYFPKELKEKGGIALRLIALENLEDMLVLKLAVENRSSANFFIKGFKASSGSQRLGERSLFKILVEAKTTRRGYVLIQKPKRKGETRMSSGLALALEEEGGKNRVIEIPIPDPF